jgi:hypothetical protein
VLDHAGDFYRISTRPVEVSVEVNVHERQLLSDGEHAMP